MTASRGKGGEVLVGVPAHAGAGHRVPVLPWQAAGRGVPQCRGLLGGMGTDRLG